ncbi:MAG TPA: hypothetical protein VN728_08815 [Stellaceae bacterium]|nr:hypothetical protein [Stellaceae bacterium]
MSEQRNNRPEAEIIPPGAPDRGRWRDPRGGERPGERTRIWAWSNDPRYAGLRYGRPGPLGLIAIFAGLAALGALGFFVFLGALAITLPVIAALVLAGILGGILRRL